MAHRRMGQAGCDRTPHKARTLGAPKRSKGTRPGARGLENKSKNINRAQRSTKKGDTRGTPTGGTEKPGAKKQRVGGTREPERTLADEKWKLQGQWTTTRPEPERMPKGARRKVEGTSGEARKKHKPRHGVVPAGKGAGDR